jgi:hypothetical protein
MHEPESNEPHILDDIRTDVNVPEDATPEQKLDIVQKAALNQQRRDLFMDKSYYTCIVFQSGAQLQEFMEKAGWKTEVGEYWIDGLKLAKAMGIELKPVDRALLARVYSRRPNKPLQDALKKGLKLFNPTRKVVKKNEHS